MILTAGLGTRMRPLTLERAKPSIPLLGIPLVIRLIKRLTAAGASAFRLNLHHLPQTIEALRDSREWGYLPVSFSYEQHILGTGGGLKANEPFFDQGTFLMANGDIVVDFALEEAIAFHRQRRPLATLVLYPQQYPFVHYPMRIDEARRIRNFKGAAEGGKLLPEVYVFTGIHILEPEIFRFIPRDQPSSITDDAYTAALKSGAEICGYPVHGYWNDLGTPQRYLQAQRDVFLREAIRPSVTVATDAKISETAVLEPFVSVCRGCEVGDRARIENSILWEGARVNSGSILENCIIGSGVTVRGEFHNRAITRYGEVNIA